MANFPNSFVEQVEPIDGGIGELGDSALASLRERGLTFATGITEYFAGAVGLMGYQPHIREWCRNDADAPNPADSRFVSLASTETWLKKGGGRGMFLLLRGEGNSAQLEGYGWAGLGTCEKLPDYDVTSAFRIGDRAAGQGFGKAFTQALVAATHTLYCEGEQIGGEIWKSNLRAAGMYVKAGFDILAEADHDELRPTLDPNAVDGMVLDRRQYIGFKSDLLE